MFAEKICGVGDGKDELTRLFLVNRKKKTQPITVPIILSPPPFKRVSQCAESFSLSFVDGIGAQSSSLNL